MKAYKKPETVVTEVELHAIIAMSLGNGEAGPGDGLSRRQYDFDDEEE
ncbi:MAG: hypothetical protein HUK02_09405 [Bacteroidaceae bacterium]|nr:hypothetical protein [Bacteroidaceae bacterium]